MEEELHQRDTVGVQDFILLEDYTDPKAFITNLKKRFKEHLIYTSIGTVLVSVNPYQQLDIYNEQIIKTYRSVNFYELPPHIFSIADSAYRNMCSEQRDQCVLISGESGSGKTEASKKVLQYVAVTSAQSEGMSRITDRLLQSNPLLEAFGNAKTNCNDNSSRFGKYMDIQFNFKGAPIGGHIFNYLLEKSRVVHQASGERNFHIFYQLLAGGDEKLLHKLYLLKTPPEYYYLGQGETEIDEVDDSKNFHDVLSALDICQFSQEQQQSLFQIIGFVLHLGEVEFKEEDMHAVVTDPDNVHTISKIVGCSFAKLLSALQSRTIDTRTEKVVTPFNLDQARYARDALAKNVYDRMFSWIVENVNTSLNPSEPGASTLMGLLDIYGFEIFEVNSFEQFCINYCNEKLQQLFIELTLKSEQEEYHREGIEWEQVIYFNNKIICELIEDKTLGIIAILDEECMRPGNVSDMSFLSKLTHRAGRHAHFVSHETTDTATRKTITRMQFRLRHYAGDVTYDVDGFLDKNNDLFFRDLKEAMIHSRNTILSECFPLKELESRKRPLSAASQFRNSLTELMETLMSKEPSYVRCIKPNDHKKPDMFEDKIVLHQIKYLGVMENVRVRRAGFAYRRPYEVFLRRYKSLCPATWPNYRGNVKEGVKLLVQHLQYDPFDYRLGASKLFIKSPKLLFSTEDAFQRRKHELATIIQSAFRCHYQKRQFRIMKQSAVRVQCLWRRVSAKQKMESRKKAVNHIRQFIRGFMMRKLNECSDNEKFIQVTRRNYLARLKRMLPVTVLDKSWLTPPELVVETSRLLRDLCMRNLTLKYVKNIDPRMKHIMEEKVIAESLFRSKKELYPYSVRDHFVVSRLASHHDQLMETVFKVKHKTPDETICYASAVIKYDRHGYKPRTRVLVATDRTIFILCPKTFDVKEKIPISIVKGLLLSKLSDGLFLIITERTDINENGLKGDLILQADYVIEAVTKIAIGAKLLDHVKVSSAYSLEHTLQNGKSGVIDFSEGEDYKVKKARGRRMSVCVPRVIYGPTGRSMSTPML